MSVGAVDWLAALWVGATCAVVMWRVRPPLPSAAARVRPYTTVTRVALGLPPEPSVAGADATASVVLGPLRDAARAFSRLIESRGDDAIALRLHQAGRDQSVDEYRVQQVTRGALFAGAFVLVAVIVMPRPLTVVALGVVGFVFGSARVRADVDGAIERRTERMRLELATVAPMLALQVRSGAGPIQAVQRVVERGHGAVVDELGEILIAVRAGQREPDAFRHAAARTPCRDAARVYQLFAAGSERGSDLATALLAVTADLRDARREELRRSTVRRRAVMLAPTIGVLAPIMLLFIAAPLPSIVLGSR